MVLPWYYLYFLTCVLCAVCAYTGSIHVAVRTDGRTRQTRQTRQTDARDMTSVFAKCTPGSYDTLEAAAKGLTHATLACALVGSCGFHGTGYTASVASMAIGALVALETQNKGLLKVRDA